MGNGEWQVEMTWRCTSCRHQNLGRHTTCVQCGDPKDASETYEMPGAADQAAQVSDPALLRIATAGPNWRCGYCESDQRRSDGTCARCGAAPVEPLAQPVAPSRSRQRVVQTPARGSWFSGLTVLLVAVPLLVCFGAVMSIAPRRPAPVSVLPAPPRHVDALVEAVEWQREIRIDRYRNWRREGFAEQRPANATKIRALGERVHHTDRVPDGFDTEHYRERVQEGFDTEWYSERVECGQDCTPLPEQCRQECAPNGNGFATCRNVCTPGGQQCSPRHCDERRSRQVPRLVDVDRTRQVPRFRDEPRRAAWFEWRVWDWGEDRVVRAEGRGTDVRWPESEARLGLSLSDGEQERERRIARYQVTLRYDGAQRFTLMPATDREFARFALASHHVLRIAEYQSPVLEDPAPEALTDVGVSRQVENDVTTR